MTVEWRDVPGWEGLYKVSSEGQVFSVLKNKIKEMWADKNGYLKVGLYRGIKGQQKSVHRLVAQAFIPNPENKPEIDHIDTNPTNNAVYNLRWVTRYENRHNPISMLKYAEIDHRTNLGKRGKLQPQTKPIRCIELNKIFWGTFEAERALGVDHRHIQDILHGRARRKTAGGYHWEYIKRELAEELDQLSPTVGIKDPAQFPEESGFQF